jgi:hypothetical protein
MRDLVRGAPQARHPIFWGKRYDFVGVLAILWIGYVPVALSRTYYHDQPTAVAQSTSDDRRTVIVARIKQLRDELSLNSGAQQRVPPDQRAGLIRRAREIAQEIAQLEAQLRQLG